jgi:two-component system sensor kinase FixL
MGLLVLVMTVTALAVGGTAILILYRVSFEQQQRRIVDITQSQARLIDVVAQFDERYSQYPGGSKAATLAQIAEAHQLLRTPGIGITGEFVLAERRGDKIHYVLHELPENQHLPEYNSWGGSRSEAMQRALSGETGSLVGQDYRGKMVLAGFAPVPSLNLGLVAKLDLAEIRTPFVRAALIVAALAAVLIASAAALFSAVGDPLIRRLRASEANYRRIFEQSPMAILILDPGTTRPIAFNDQLLAILRYDRDEFAQMPLERYEARETPAEVRAHLDAIVAGSRRDYETQWRSHGGALRDVVVNARVVEVNGRPSVHSVVADVTRRVRAERRVRELQQQLLRVTRASELGQTVSTLAHELGQPLTAANNYVNAARRLIETPSPAPIERAVAALKKAAEQIERASAIIRGLRLFLQRREPECALRDLNAVVSEATEVMLSSAVEAGVEVNRQFAPDLPPVAIDIIQIQQVIVNLINNALEAVKGSPRRLLHIATERREGSVQVSVADTGIGLDPEIAQRMFQPFVTDKPGGIGMGLAIARTIIETHGGRLWAEPNPGGGSIFRFTLPVSEAGIGLIAAAEGVG